jgi:hypothetical protein
MFGNLLSCLWALFWGPISLACDGVNWLIGGGETASEEAGDELAETVEGDED